MSYRSGVARQGILAAVVVAGLCVALVLAAASRRLGPETSAAPEGPFIRKPATYLEDPNASEPLHDQAVGEVKKTLVRGLRNADDSLMRAALAPGFLAKFPAAPAGKDTGAFPWATTRRYDPALLKPLGSEEFLATLRTHTAPWSIVERASWRTFEFFGARDGRSAAGSAHLSLGGKNADGKRGELQGSIRFALVLDGASWKLSRLEWYEGCRVDSRILPFRDVTDTTGFHWNEAEHNRENLQALINSRGPNTVGGLTALDWNRDGFQDVVATLAGKTAVLFLNDGRGGFVRGLLPYRSPREPGFVFLYADLDGDGFEDIVNGQIQSFEGTRARMSVYTRERGEWKCLPGALEFEAGRPADAPLPQTVVPGDVDGDGDLDLFIGFYSKPSSRTTRFNSIAAYDGADSALFINQGGLRFTEESDARGIVSTQYVLAAAFFDFDGDGDEDLFQCNDYGPNVFWDNDGGGRFRELKDHPFAQGSCYTMGVAIADFDGTGTWSVHVSNMYSHAGNRILRQNRNLNAGWRSTALNLAAGNWLYERDGPKGGWKETGESRGIHFADWAWACPFGDIDNDGDKDLFISTGYTSHSDPAKPDY
jgi:hypothetical protein